ncbi:HD domain-containing protein [Salinibacterium sp. NYA9b]
MNELNTTPERPTTEPQRFYTRFTDTGFLHVGTFTGITLNGERRYFMWQTDQWKEIYISGFEDYRDDGDTHFAETSRADIQQLNPGAVETEPGGGSFLDAYFGHDPDDPINQQWRTTEQAEPAEDESYADDTEEDEDEDDMLMTEVDAMVQHGIAVGIATIAHRGQLDKLGYDYIDHPARVAENFDWLNEPVEHCTAWLHDVIEDTDISASDLLKAGMLPEIVTAVELLTRRADVADADYYGRIRQNPAALAVKLADINDNLADWRFRKLDYDTQVRLSNKYFQARQLLQPTPDETENS